jgi:hypothetical protein
MIYAGMELWGSKGMSGGTEIEGEQGTHSLNPYGLTTLNIGAAGFGGVDSSGNIGLDH